MKKILVLLIAVLLFSSCQECFDLENGMQPTVIVNGAIDDMGDQCTVRLTKTADYFCEDTDLNVRGALVTITNESGESAPFDELEPGVYTEDEILGMPNTSYTLTIIADGAEYKAQASIPEKVHIESLTYRHTTQDRTDGEGFVVSCKFSDPGAVQNFYRLKTYLLNDEREDKENLQIFTDESFNGNMSEVDWENGVFQENDIVVVELYTLDEPTYDYYRSISSYADGGLAKCDPFAPESETNITNGALGIFAAYTISRDTIVISTRN